MEKITLEKVDMVKERTNVTYEEAKEALEACDGDVLEALIYIEKNQEEAYKEDTNFEENCKNSLSVDELKTYIKELIAKGNITRIKIKKDEKELADIPVNAGIAATMIGIIIPPILATVVIAAIATKITIEITKEDGTVEVVNKYVSKVASDMKEKASNIAGKVKNKVDEVKKENTVFTDDSKQKKYTGNETIYSYTVNFDEEDHSK
ncbi:MAG: DUF4342 domain-containing protein [Clostridium butyricum]|nr:DUF4342 domain-containing protein [Clostridium butyricum]